MLIIFMKNRTWSPLRRFNSATQQIAALIPAWWVRAAKIVAENEKKKSVDFHCTIFERFLI